MEIFDFDSKSLLQIFLLLQIKLSKIFYHILFYHYEDTPACH